MKGNEYFNRFVDLVIDTTNTDELFDAIISNTTVAEAAKVLGVHKDRVKGLLRARGVRHEYGQRYKEAVLDFLDAGSPVQLELFAVTCWSREALPLPTTGKEKIIKLTNGFKDYNIDTEIEYDLEEEIRTPVKNKL